MSTESERELQQRLQQLEAEVKGASVPDYQVQKMTNTDGSGFTSANIHVERIVTWFKSLSKTAQVVVLAAGFFMTLAIVQALFKLVTAAISLAMLSVLVYLGYKFFVSNNLKGK